MKIIENGRKKFEIARNGWKWLEWLEMAENGWNGWKWLKMA